ncbi:hypothetical protein AB1L88_26290 [Tautonia sp. JC769]|uniref:hypothetical protein n=1 Tax=Tautonia sp. JC769 TaxID=3232135 RepID=UPI0034584DA2
MRNRSRIGLAVALGASLLSATATQAQPVFGDTESIESLAANADLVFVGTLETFKDQADPDGHEAAIIVEDTLKVPRGECYTKLGARLPGPASLLTRWEGEPHRLLVFVKEEDPTAAVIDLADENLEVFTANLSVLRDRDLVIEAAREMVRETPVAVRRLQTFRLDAPRELLKGTRWETLDGLRVNVPVDDRLERRAIEALRSEDDFRRLEGIQALWYFKSDENVERLKPLLDDPASRFRPAEAGQYDGPGIRHYYIREEAYRTLTSWGVEVEPPVLREEVTPDKTLK